MSDDIGAVLVWTIIIVVFIVSKLKSVVEEALGGENASGRLERLREYRRQLREGLAESRVPTLQAAPEALTPAEATAMLGGKGKRRSLAQRLAAGEEPSTAAARTTHVEQRQLGTLVPHQMGELEEFVHDVPDVDRAYELKSREKKGFTLPEGLSPAATAFVMMEVFGPPRAARDYQSPDQTWSMKG